VPVVGTENVALTVAPVPPVPPPNAPSPPLPPLNAQCDRRHALRERQTLEAPRKSERETRVAPRRSAHQRHRTERDDYDTARNATSQHHHQSSDHGPQGRPPLACGRSALGIGSNALTTSVGTKAMVPPRLRLSLGFINISSASPALPMP
jgi:hypothetical protein